MTTGFTIGIFAIVFLFVLILCGIHIGVALLSISVVGVYLITGKLATTMTLLAGTVFSAVREYNFAVLPLFILMGVFMSKSGAAGDLFRACNMLLRKIPGGLGVSTVLANTIFAAVTGVSVASAAVFSKVAFPEMIKFNYSKPFAIGTVAGSSVIGMLIPPSALMIIYGMLAEVSVGKLFVAGVLPGILLACIYSAYIITTAIRNPALAGREMKDGKPISIDWSKEESFSLKVVLCKPLPVVGLIALVLGGVWGGFFTPSEAAAFGALGAMILSFFSGMRLDGFKKCVLEAAESTAAILFLLTAANMYAKLLSLSTIITRLGSFIIDLNPPSVLLVTMFCVILILLGCILDSTSILLITVPLMIPIMSTLGYDLIWFGIIMIVTTEMGLLTPPFGMVAFSIKATLRDSISVEEIFKGSLPYLALMILLIVILYLFPPLCTYFPSMLTI